MPSAEDWCHEQLANLQIADRRLDTLAEIRNHLTVQPSSASWLSLRDIFACIDDGGGAAATTTTTGGANRQQTTLACDILSICMSTLAIDESQNRQYLLQCLQHGNADVRLLGLHEVERAIAAGQAPDANVTLALVAGLQHASESVGVPTVRLLARLLPAADRLADPAVRDALRAAAATSVMCKCRVYELAVTIARQSEAGLQSVDFVLADLIGELDAAVVAGDVLLQLNVLELLADLAQADHAHVLLENRGCYAQITRFARALQADPMRDLLVPGYMRFFGALATGRPQRVIDGFPEMIDALFACLADASDAALMPVALDTLGHLTRSADGAVLLHERYAERLRETLHGLRTGLNGLPTALQVRTLNCLEEMFRVEGDEPVNNQVT